VHIPETAVDRDPMKERKQGHCPWDTHYQFSIKSLLSKTPFQVGEPASDFHSSFLFFSGNCVGVSDELE